MAQRMRVVKRISKVAGLVFLVGVLVLVGVIAHSCRPSERMAGDALLEDRGSGAARQRYTGHLTELDLAEDGEYQFHLEDLPTPGGSINWLAVGFSMPMARGEVLGQDLEWMRVEVRLLREGREVYHIDAPLREWRVSGGIAGPSLLYYYPRKGAKNSQFVPDANAEYTLILKVRAHDDLKPFPAEFIFWGGGWK